MFKNTFEHTYTWLNGFLRNVKRFATKNAIIDVEEKRTWNYKELNCEANKLANALQKDNIKKNDVVMLVMRNCPEFCFAYIGVRKTGAILLAANGRLASGELALLIEHNKPKIIIYSANEIDCVTQATKKSKWKVKKIILADNIENITVPQNHINYKTYTNNQSTENPTVKIKTHIYDEVLRLCTSGTTALPKSVPINDINEVLSAHDVIMNYPLNSADVTLNMTPWFHRGGLHSGGPCPTFYVGCSLIVMRRFQPKNALDWVEKYNITFMTGTPSNLEMLCLAQEQKKRNLFCLKGIITMGAPLSTSSCIRFMQVLTKNIFNGYGTTETFWNTFQSPFYLPKEAGSVGSSCIDDEVRIIKIQDGTKKNIEELVEQDGKTKGEIIIRCPEKTTYSYYKNKTLQKQKFVDGWMYTGDIGTWDKNCHVTICGRKDNMIIVSGENIHPEQVEDALCESSFISNCVVTSVFDSIRGQALVAYVVPKNKNVTLKEVHDFCIKSPHLSDYKLPRYFAFIKEVPLTATGKKERVQLKKRAELDLQKGLLKRP